jgi:hypothetical protein
LQQLPTSVAIVFAIGLNAASVYGFCHDTTCEITPTPAGCKGSFDTNGCSDEGLSLHWGTPCFSFSVHEGGSSRCGIRGDALEGCVRSAFDAWSAVTCDDGGSPNFFVATYPQVTCQDVGFRGDGPNQNLWIFRDDRWEHEILADGAIALTTLSVDLGTGEIYDADVELNSKENDFTLGDDNVQTDLSSIVLHEAGHVLGIGHSPWSTSTMAGSYLKGTTDTRTLKADDIDAICAILPPRELPSRCDPEPRQGFSAQCDASYGGCCSMARGRTNSALTPAASAMFLLVARRRKPARASQRSRHRNPKDARPRW